MAVVEACTALFWPTPGFKGRTFELWVLFNRWDLTICVRSSPLRGSRDDIYHYHGNQRDCSRYFPLSCRLFFHPRKNAQFDQYVQDWDLGNWKEFVAGCLTCSTVNPVARFPPLTEARSGTVQFFPADSAVPRSCLERPGLLPSSVARYWLWRYHRTVNFYVERFKICFMNN